MTSPTPEEVKALRERAGLSQVRLSAALGVSEKTWERWEGGKAVCHPVMWRGVLSVAEELGLLRKKR